MNSKRNVLLDRITLILKISLSSIGMFLFLFQYILIKYFETQLREKQNMCIKMLIIRSMNSLQQQVSRFFKLMGAFRKLQVL